MTLKTAFASLLAGLALLVGAPIAGADTDGANADGGVNWGKARTELAKGRQVDSKLLREARKLRREAADETVPPKQRARALEATAADIQHDLKTRAGIDNRLFEIVQSGEGSTPPTLPPPLPPGPSPEATRPAKTQAFVRDLKKLESETTKAAVVLKAAASQWSRLPAELTQTVDRLEGLMQEIEHSNWMAAEIAAEPTA